MSVAGMLSDPLGQADDRIAVDPDQAFGLSDATSLGEVLEHGAGLLLGQMGVEERRALALGEAVFAGLAVEQADVVVLAVAAADGEVCGVALAEEAAIGILAAEACEVVHGLKTPGGPG
jgi:repressor of nif and glnA expression